MSNIKLAQSPIIEYSELDRIAVEVDKRLSVYNFSEIIVDEDNVKAIKKLRAELNAELKEFEEVRKNIKKLVLEPYEAFNAEYEAKIASKYKNAENALKTLVVNVENGLKQKKVNEVVEYFEELKFANDLDFVKFEHTHITVGLSDSVKSLKENARTFIENVKKDLMTIKSMDNSDRVLSKYVRNLSLVESIHATNEELRFEKALQDKMLEKPIEPIVKEEPKAEVLQELINLSFTVWGTREQLRKLKAFLESENIRYE